MSPESRPARTRVKICGLTQRDDIEAAISGGADALGFILYAPSKRYVTASQAAALCRDLPPFPPRVCVTVNADDFELTQAENHHIFDLWQWHGDETPEDCQGWADSHRLIKALRLTPKTMGVIDPAEYPVTAFLLDTPGPGFGGTGETFDWSLARDFAAKTKVPIILSGGLTPENVAQAIEAVHPYAVDVSSGVESSPGRKDHAKLRDFLQICMSL